MNIAQAKVAALGAGIPEGDITVAVLEQFGWSPSAGAANALAVDISGPAVSPAQVVQYCDALVAEAKANNVASNVLNGIVKVAGMAMKFAGI